MFLKKVYLLALFTFVFLQFSHGQNKWDLQYKENIAGEYFHQNDFTKALNLYLELDSLNKKGNYKYQIGICYINLEYDEKALPYLEKCLATPDLYPPGLYFYVARAYHLNHRFDEAITNFSIFREKLVQGNKKSDKHREEALLDTDREIEMCNYGKQLIAHPLDIKITNLGPVINSEFPDYGALLSADENKIVFTSNRPETTGRNIDKSDGLGFFYEDIYVSVKSGNEWTKPVNLGPPVNSEGNDASVSITPDGYKLIFYRSRKSGLLATNSGDLYIATAKGNTWRTPERLPAVINSDGWEPSAAISADESILYFTSNREGGFGGTDIYRVKLNPDGTWGIPVNLGPEINTKYDEDSPFIHSDGKTLYFSSKGHMTMGGFDVFVSKYDEETRKWSQPENVGYPINTAHDDIHFTWSADGKRVYFSTIRPEGYGDKDIYCAEMESRDTDILVLKGQIVDAESRKPLAAEINVTEKNSSNPVGNFSSNSGNGKYLIILSEGKEYEFSISSGGHKTVIETISIPLKGKFEVIEKDFILNLIK